MPACLGLRHTLNQDFVIPLPGFHCTCCPGIAPVSCPPGHWLLLWVSGLLGCQRMRLPGIRLSGGVRGMLWPWAVVGSDWAGPITPIFTTQVHCGPLRPLRAGCEPTPLPPVSSFTPALCDPLMVHFQSSALTLSAVLTDSLWPRTAHKGKPRLLLWPQDLSGLFSLPSCPLALCLSQ